MRLGRGVVFLTDRWDFLLTPAKEPAIFSPDEKTIGFSTPPPHTPHPHHTQHLLLDNQHHHNQPRTNRKHHQRHLVLITRRWLQPARTRRNSNHTRSTHTSPHIHQSTHTMDLNNLNELELHKRALARAKQENMFLKEHIYLLAAEIRGWEHTTDDICDTPNKCILCTTADKLEALLK